MPGILRFVALGFFLAAVFAGRAPGAQSAETAEAFDREFKSLSALDTTRAPKEFPDFTAQQREWFSRRNAEMHERGLALIAAYPAEPRRWDVVMMLTAPPPFTRQVTVDGVTRTERDLDAYRAWRLRYTAMVEELLAATDSSLSARSRAYTYLLGDYARNWR